MSTIPQGSIGSQPKRGIVPPPLLHAMVYLTIACTLYSIVQLPLLPLAPSVILPFIVAALILPEIMRTAVWRLTLWRIFLIIVIAHTIDGLFLSGLNYFSVARYGRLLASALFVLSLSVYISIYPRAFSRLLNFCLLAIGVSLIWFLFELTGVEPFHALRQVLYLDIYSVSDENLIAGSGPSGLCPFPHLLGYQLSFFLPAVTILVTFSSKSWVRVICLTGLLLGLVALFYSGQRSALTASAISLFAFLSIGRSSKGGGNLLLLFILALTALGLLVTAEYWVRHDVEASILYKLQDLSYWDEALFRLQLQYKAFELIFTHPFGLARAGLDWESAGFWPTFYESRLVGTTRTIAVHNGYLLLPLNQGLVFLALIGAFLFCLIKSALLVLRTRIASSQSSITPMSLVACVTLGLFTVQTMTHNASIFTQDPPSLVSFAFLLSALLATNRTSPYGRNTCD